MDIQSHEITEEELVQFGSRVKEIRNHLKMLQKDFANGIGISNSFLSEVEGGSSKVGHEFFFNIVKVYKVNPLYLLHGTGEMFLEEKLKKGPAKELPVGYVGPDSDLVNRMLEDFRRSSLLRFAMLEYYQRYSFQYKELIEATKKGI